MARPRRTSLWVEPLEGRRLCATLTPFNNNNNSYGSLREAMDNAVNGDTIDATGLRGVINLDWGLTSDKSLTINGPGSGLLTIRMRGSGRVLDLASGVDFGLNGVTLDDGDSGTEAGGNVRVLGTLDRPSKLSLYDVVVRDGKATENGGGLSAEFADVTLTSCRFTNNTASGDLDAVGGAVQINGGALLAKNSTFDGNVAHAAGTRVESTALGGAVSLMSAGDSMLVNCTFAGNSATADKATNVDGASATALGGGLAIATYGNLFLLSNTFAGNVAGGTGADGFGGGVGVMGFGNSNIDQPVKLKFVNSVLAGNAAGTGPDAFGLDVGDDATTAELKSNVLGVADGSGITGGVGGNRVGTAAKPLDAKLNALTDNGGLVPTMLPKAASPVLGVATAADTPDTDARGYVRSPAYDAGAVERQADYAPAFTQQPGDTAAAEATYLGQIAATDAEGNPVAFSLIAAPAWLTLTDKGDGTAQLVGTPTVDDGGAASVTVRADDGSLTTDQTFTINVGVAPVGLGGDGTLRIVGTTGDDTIHIWQPKGRGGNVRVAYGRKIRNYSAAVVKAIQIYGRDGDDTIVANCVDFGSYVQAGFGNDTVVGSDNADTISAAQGDDSVLAMGGNDWVDGNSGRDTLDGGDGDDRMYGGNGRDILTGGLGSDVLYGEAGTNIYVANDGTRDRIFGTLGAQDWVQAGDKRDLLYDGAVYL